MKWDCGYNSLFPSNISWTEEFPVPRIPVAETEASLLIYSSIFHRISWSASFGMLSWRTKHMEFVWQHVWALGLKHLSLELIHCTVGITGDVWTCVILEQNFFLCSCWDWEGCKVCHGTRHSSWIFVLDKYNEYRQWRPHTPYRVNWRKHTNACISPASYEGARACAQPQFHFHIARATNNGNIQNIIMSMKNRN